ncbi:hypothetical protein BJ912DRAFT_969167 [Pholiota molesta]|nr:hypothetical protein BJ912DRAFT_969167 [Pholiota molesta]
MWLIAYICADSQEQLLHGRRWLFRPDDVLHRKPDSGLGTPCPSVSFRLRKMQYWTHPSSVASVGMRTLSSAGSTGAGSSSSSSLLVFFSFALLWSALLSMGFWIQTPYCFYCTASRDFYCAMLAMLTEHVGLVATLRVNTTRRKLWDSHSLE